MPLNPISALSKLGFNLPDPAQSAPLGLGEDMPGSAPAWADVPIEAALGALGVGADTRASRGGALLAGTLLLGPVIRRGLEMHPAVQALLKVLSGGPSETNSARRFLGEKVGSYQIPHRAMVVPPKGFEFPSEMPSTARFVARDPALVKAYVDRRVGTEQGIKDYTLKGYKRSNSKVKFKGPAVVDETPSDFESKFSVAGLGPLEYRPRWPDKK